MKVGLALGSGAARGLSHIGVIRALEEHNIEIDMVAGTSIGAVVGCFYAAGLSVDRMVQFANDFGDRRISYWIDPTFFRGGGLLKGDKIEQSLLDLIGPLDFNDLKIPFHAVATDLSTGSEVVRSSGDLVGAVRSSFSIPAIFSPEAYNGRWLVDGAVVSPVPTRVLRKNGCDVVIGVNVAIPEERDISVENGDSPKIVEVIMQVISVFQQHLITDCMRQADIKIVPPLGQFGWTEFDRANELIDIGYQETLKQMSHIKKVISRRRKITLLKRLF